MQRELHYVPPAFVKPTDALPRLEYSGKRRAATATASAAKRKRTHDADPLAVLREVCEAPQPAELRVLSEQLARVTLATEKLCRRPAQSREYTVQVATVAWKLAARFHTYALHYRFALDDNEHRIALWIARIRCIGLASVHCLEMYETQSGIDAAAADDESSTTTTTNSTTAAAAHGADTQPLRQARLDAFATEYNTRTDRELYLAHAVLWPYDTADNRLATWCADNELLPSNVKDVDAGIRSASVITLWRMVMLLLQRWVELSYNAFLVAYVWRLLERAAALTLYSGTSREYNHPLFSTVLGNDEYCMNERFLTETERTFYALEVQLRRCSYLRWPDRVPRRTHDVLSKRSGKLLPDAVQRLDEFVTRELEEGQFLRYIEKDFEVVLFDHLLLPGEMERFEQQRPYDDRKPLTCLSRMRRNDYDRYNRLFLEPNLKDVWRYLLDNRMHTHPAYMVVVSRVLQYYFDAQFNGAQLDAYFVSIERVPLTHLKENVASALRDHGRDAAVLTRGSAAHTLCGTFLTHGLEFTKESAVPHPLMVQCVGAPVLVVGDESTVVRQRGVKVPHFGTVFLAWLHEFCADERLAGTLANGSSVVPLLRTLRPTADTDVVAKRADALREALDQRRTNLTGLEEQVQLMDAHFPAQSDSNTFVL